MSYFELFQTLPLWMQGLGIGGTLAGVLYLVYSLINSWIETKAHREITGKDL